MTAGSRITKRHDVLLEDTRVWYCTCQAEQKLKQARGQDLRSAHKD